MIIPEDMADALRDSRFHTDLLVHQKVTIDNSSYNEWDGCPVKGLYLLALKKRLAGRADALSFGGAFHKGMEAFHLGQPIKDAIGAAQKEAAILGFDKTRKAFPEEKRTLESLRDAIFEYKMWWDALADHFIPMDIEGRPMVEQTFAMDMGNVETGGQYGPFRFYWTGQIDMIIARNDGLWIVDHKTTTVMGAKFADDLQRSSQMLGYVMATRDLLTRLDYDPAYLRGVIINACALRTKGFDFARFELPFPQWTVDEWITEMKARVAHLIELYLDCLHEMSIPATRSHCVTKYGKCEYFDVCQAHPSLRMRHLNSGDFEDDTWDPLQNTKI